MSFDQESFTMRDITGTTGTKSIVDLVTYRIPAEFKAHSLTEDTPRVLETNALSNGVTVVLTIQYQGDAKKIPTQIMATFAQNTHSAIINAVKPYLNSKNALSQRMPRITSGIGRNGEQLDLSRLADNMWLLYLQYSSKLTSFPELTVELVDN